MLYGCSTQQSTKTICLLDPTSDRLVCAGPNGQELYVPFKDAEDFVCIHPKDFYTILIDCKVAP